jgi:hypothetical protein
MRLLALTILSATLLYAGSVKATGTGMYDNYEKGVAYFNLDKYDSALLFLRPVIAYAEQNPGDTDAYIANSYYYAALCFEGNAEPVTAHAHFGKALQLARKSRLSLLEEDIITAINQLHWLVIKNNWKFNYPPATTTIPEWVYYSIKRVDSLGIDSLQLTIYGGSYDGIIDTNYRAEIYSVANPKVQGSAFNGIDVGYLKAVGENRAIVIMKKPDDASVNAGDLVSLKTDVPVNVTRSAFYKYLLYGINFTNNYKERNYERRYYFHYYDPQLDSTVFRCFKKNVDEIVELFAQDSTLINTRADEGIFKDEVLGQAMKRSTPEHLQLFLNFVLAYPGKYIGNNFKFSETYATWMINKTPLERNDITRYLLRKAGTRECQK